MTSVALNARSDLDLSEASAGLLSVSAGFVRTASFAGLVILLGVGGGWHRPWFDEAQSWLLARDTTPWTLVSHAMRYEGSPGLWQMLLQGLQRIGYPFAGLWLVSSTLSAFGAWLILFRSPFPTWLRIGLVFSYFIAFQYAVVARSYALDVALFPLIALCFPHRVIRPRVYALLLGALANCNAHSFVIACPFALEFAWALRTATLKGERAALLAHLLTWALLLAVVLQAWPAADISSPSSRRGFDAVRAAVMLGEALIDRVDVWSTPAPGGFSRMAGVALSMAMLTPIAGLCAASGRRLLFWGVLLAFLGFTAVQFANLWHAGVLYLALICLTWISWEARPALPRGLDRALITGLAVLVACQDVATAKAWVHEVRWPYSGAPAAAQALKTRLHNHPRERVAALSDRSFAVQPWFARNLFASYHSGAPKPAYYIWSTAEPTPFTPYPAAWRALLAGGYDWVLVGNLNQLAGGQRSAFDRVSSDQGYCLKQTFQGAINWRGYAREPDDLSLYGRCTVAWREGGR